MKEVNNIAKLEPHVWIIILNWNGYKDTISCVESVQKMDYSNYAVLIVDNGSSDESEKIIRDRFPDIPLVQTGKNLGFAGGNNVGIRHVLKQRVEYIWLLNNDTTVDRHALAALVGGLQQDAKAGIAVSKIYYFSSPDIIWFAGGIWSPARHFAAHRGLNEKDTGQYAVATETDFATGCSLLFKSKLVSEIGYLKEDYFLYWEDMDWCLSARESGWKILYVPASVIWHKVSTSVENNSSAQFYYYFRSGLLFYSRHAPKSLFRFAANHIVYALNQYFRGKKNILRGYSAGLKDFIFKRFGGRIQRL